MPPFALVHVRSLRLDESSVNNGECFLKFLISLTGAQNLVCWLISLLLENCSPIFHFALHFFPCRLDRIALTSGTGVSARSFRGTAHRATRRTLGEVGRAFRPGDAAEHHRVFRRVHQALLHVPALPQESRRLSPRTVVCSTPQRRMRQTRRQTPTAELRKRQSDGCCATTAARRCWRR